MCRRNMDKPFISFSRNMYYSSCSSRSKILGVTLDSVETGSCSLAFCTVSPRAFAMYVSYILCFSVPGADARSYAPSPESFSASLESHLHV